MSSSLKPIELKRAQELVKKNVATTATRSTTNLDELLNTLGSFGLYQIVQFILIAFLAIMPSMIAYSYVFVSATPKFTCSIVRRIQTATMVALNVRNVTSGKTTVNDYLESPKRFENSIEVRRLIKLENLTYDSRCDLDPIRLGLDSGLNESWIGDYRVGKVEVMFECAHWVYDDSIYGKTSVTEWDLICSKSHLKALTQNFYILGTGCSLLTGILSDLIGRRSALTILIVLLALTLSTTQFILHTPVIGESLKFALFCLSRFLQGLGQTMYSIAMVLLLEITGPKHRVFAANVLAYGFAVGQLFLVGVVYWLRDWLKVNWMLAIYVWPFMAYFWMVPESPRWLLSVGKVREARRVLDKIALWNKWGKENFLDNRLWRKLICKKHAEPSLVDNAHLITLLQDDSRHLASIRRSTSLRHTIGEIIHAPQLLYRSIILFYTWSVILAVYLGIGMGIAGNLDSYMHPHRVFVAAAIFEFLSILTCHVILDRFGRKNTLVTCMAFTCVYTYLIPINLAHQTPYISMAFYFAAKFTIGAAQLTCMIYTSEVYPTRMRSTGLGLSAAVARIGGVWAPQINVLSTSLGSMHIPFYIFSLMSFVAALGCLFLPETQNKNLPENVGDAKKLNN